MKRPRGTVSRIIYLLLLITGPAAAQSFDPNAVHWAYSAYFGTGWYRVGDNRDAFVVRVTPRWDLRETRDGDYQQVGVEFRLPVTAGLDNFTFDDPGESLNPGNLATLSITPGINMTLPLSERWQLKPYASVGWGSVLNNTESAWTYWAGVKSRYVLMKGRYELALLNDFGYAGYNPSNSDSEDFFPLMAGLELDHPLGDFTLGDAQAVLTWHGMFTGFDNELDAVLDNGQASSIDDQWEFGVAVRREDQQIKIWRLSFIHIQRTTSDLFIFKRFNQSCLIDNPTTRAVN